MRTAILALAATAWLALGAVDWPSDFWDQVAAKLAKARGAQTRGDGRTFAYLGDALDEGLHHLNADLSAAFLLSTARSVSFSVRDISSFSGASSCAFLTYSSDLSRRFVLR